MAPPPVPYALPKAMCGNQLLAQVAIDKYCDHLPTYRQSERFAREGIDLPRSTLVRWLMEFAELLRPIQKWLTDQVRGGGWVRADATGVPVLDPPNVKGKAHHGLLVKADGVVRAGCWAHARRTFYEALTYDAKRSLRALGAIRQLFLAERVVLTAPLDQPASRLTPQAVREAWEAARRTFPGTDEWPDLVGQRDHGAEREGAHGRRVGWRDGGERPDGFTGRLRPRRRRISSTMSAWSSTRGGGRSGTRWWCLRRGAGRERVG